MVRLIVDSSLLHDWSTAGGTRFARDGVTWALSRLTTGNDSADNRRMHNRFATRCGNVVTEPATTITRDATLACCCS